MEITKYAYEAIVSVRQTGFLEQEDLSCLEKLHDELQDTFQKRQMWRTETEMRVSVLNDLHFPTPAAKYWQAVREQGVFFENLAVLSFDYKRNEVKIRKLKRDIAKIKKFDDPEEQEIALEEIRIDLEEAEFKQKNMQVAARDRVREIRLWSKIKAEMVAQDPTFDTENVNSHQLVSYGLSFANDFACCNESTPPADMRNLKGKFQTVIRNLDEEGLLGKMPPEWLAYAEECKFIQRTELKSIQGGK